MLGTKQESWVWVIKFVKSWPDHHVRWIPITAFVLPILPACVDEGLAPYFRVGQAMTDIIFSTAERHGLEQHDPPPPRITLLHETPCEEWSITYSHFHLLGEPDAAERRTKGNAENAIPVLKSYLTDLWQKTHPDDPLPAPLVNSE